MSNPTEIEAALFLLRDFLEREKERERKGITLETVHKAVTAHSRRFEMVVEEQIGQGLRLDRYGKRIRKLELAREGKEPDSERDEESTGNFRIVEAQQAAKIAALRQRTDMLESEHREAKSLEQFWRNWWAKLLAAAVVAMFTAGCSAAGGLTMYYLTHGGAK